MTGVYHRTIATSVSSFSHIYNHCVSSRAIALPLPTTLAAGLKAGKFYRTFFSSSTSDTKTARRFRTIAIGYLKIPFFHDVFTAARNSAIRGDQASILRVLPAIALQHIHFIEHIMRRCDRHRAWISKNFLAFFLHHFPPFALRKRLYNANVESQSENSSGIIFLSSSQSGSFCILKDLLGPPIDLDQLDPAPENRKTHKVSLRGLGQILSTRSCVARHGLLLVHLIGLHGGVVEAPEPLHALRIIT